MKAFEAGFGRITKKQAAQYDTHLDDSDDEFFDRTVGGMAFAL